MTLAFMKLAWALLLFLLAGGLLLKIIDRAGDLALWTRARTAVSFMLGLGAVSLQMFLYSVASIPFGGLSITLPWVLALVIALSHRGLRHVILREHRSKEGVRLKDFRSVETAFLAVIAVQAVYVFSYSMLLPITGWDAWAIWFLKAKAFFVDRGVSTGFLLDRVYGYNHPDYPLLVPLSAAWVYTALGSANEPFAKALYPLQFLLLLVIFHYGAARAAGSRTSIVFTALLSLTPLVVIHSAGLPSSIGGLYSGDFVGYADLTLSIYILGGGVLLYLFVREGRTSQLTLATLFLAFGAWTKNEGLTFAAIAVAAASAHMLTTRKLAILPLIKSLFILSIVLAPWAAYRSYHGISSEYTGNIFTFFENTGRFKTVGAAFFDYFFGKVALFNFTWYLYFLSLAVCRKSSLSREGLALNALILGQMSVYFFVYIITPADVEWHIRTSLERLLLHLVPLAMFSSAVNAHSFLALKDSGAREPGSGKG